MAAHMEGTARGADVAQALNEMAEPQDRQAFHLRRANAMTDVTGFGLAGHIAAICRASRLSAEISADAIPVYSGARDLSDRGVHSSLYHPNVDNAPTRGRSDPLLHDPQACWLLYPQPRQRLRSETWPPKVKNPVLSGI